MGSALSALSNVVFESADAAFDLGGYDTTLSGITGDGGSVLLGSKTLTVDLGQDAAAEFGGTIGGSGSLIKAGMGSQEKYLAHKE